MGTHEVKRMSRGQSQTKAQSHRRILERSKGKEKINNVVLIDVDSCNSHDFIIVDGPESSEHVLQSSKVSANEKMSPSSNIISIDDDDDDPGNGKGGANLESDVNPREVSRPAPRQSQNSEESDSDECQFTQEKTFPLNLSKCRRTYSGKTLPRNRFGLYSDSDSSSSESETSDFEVMEGSSGNIRDQWERAASKKKMSENPLKGRSGLEDEASASGSFTDAPENVEVEKTTEQDSRGCYRSNNINEGGDSSTSTIPVDGTTVDPMGNDFVVDFDHTFFQGSPSCFKTQSWERANFPPRNSNNQYGGKKLSEEPSICDTETDSDKDLIGQREKFKETDEYKRAMEEEWASRQRELQIQAEEAKRLRKRKKAETSRLLDMEKRQKQRLKEMRETQKKDVETLNLKEEIRAEVRKELDKLESKYSDMASLLRYLGIEVSGGINPTSSEVQAAYRQALLKFHPDQASKTSDIRQQVEAEEKFKLIVRLKKKQPT